MTKSDIVEGSPISVGKVTVVPLSLVSAGFAGVGGKEEEEDLSPDRSEENSFFYTMQVKPVAVAVFSEEGVEVLSITEQEELIDKVFERIPDLVNRIKI